MQGGGWIGLQKEIAALRQRDGHRPEKRQPPIERRVR